MDSLKQEARTEFMKTRAYEKLSALHEIEDANFFTDTLVDHVYAQAVKDCSEKVGACRNPYSGLFNSWHAGYKGAEVMKRKILRALVPEGTVRK